MKKFITDKYKIIICLILLFPIIVSILNAWNDAIIYDEVAHIPAGYSYLIEHDMRLNPEHPPLIKDLSAIPLLFLRPTFDTSYKFWQEDVNGQWDQGRNLLFHSGNNPDLIIFWSRFPIILIYLLLGLFIFKWTCELAGIIAGLFALTLYAFDPNILGHNHFVTTDLGIAAFITFSFYYFIEFLKNPSWKNVFLAGIFLGLVQLAKFSSIMIFPVLAIIVLIYSLVKDNKESSKIKIFGELVAKSILAFVISIFVVWIVYFINTSNIPSEKVIDLTNTYFPASDQNIKSVLTREIIFSTNNNTITRPLSIYFMGIAMVFKRVAGGNTAYFMGEVSKNAFLAYFPVVFLIKETLFFLFFMLCAIAISLGKKVMLLKKYIAQKTNYRVIFGDLSKYIRLHVAEISFFLFIILYSYTSITGNLNIGFRHLFPILPFSYILISVIIFRFIRKINSSDSFLIKVVIFFLTLAMIVGTIFSYPYYMSYFNSLVGGPKNGYLYVTDSNADWGQDLKRLKKYLSEHPEIEKIHTDYFGGGDSRFYKNRDDMLQYYIGDKYIMWGDNFRPVEDGWYAISVGYLLGSLNDPSKKSESNYSWIKNIKPIDQVGTSILIYYISPEEASIANNF